jgi:hypothetical protein
LIKEKLKHAFELSLVDVANDLDMVSEFSNTELEQELLLISDGKLKVTTHVLLFRAFLLTKGVEPYDFLKSATTNTEKLMCIELIAS